MDVVDEAVHAVQLARERGPVVEALTVDGVETPSPSAPPARVRSP
ncbi:hypothetical protein ACFYR1_35345 [Streptomyces canus]